MNQFDQFDDSDPFRLSEALISPTPSPPLPQLPRNAPDTLVMLSLPPLATYPSREALFETIQAWAKPRGYAFINGKSKKTASGRCKVYFACDRRPPIRPNIGQNRVRNTQSRGSGCQFSIVGIESPLDLGWEVRYRPGAEFNTHNHTPSKSPTAHITYRRLSIAAQNTAKQLCLAGVQPRNTLTLMHQIAPETPLIPRDLYNYNASFRRDIRQGQSPTEALLQHLESSGIKHNILKDPANQRLKGLFIACPESIAYLQSHHDVVLIDNTYSTNRFNMPLMDIIGNILVSGLNTTFQG
jgi:hypothetical protein